MSKYFSAATMGFYDSSINTKIPSGAVQLTDQEYNNLLQGQNNGKLIVIDANGRPVLASVPAPTPEEVAADNKRQASQLLYESDFYTKEAIADPSKSSPHLTNQADFFDYQNKLRAIALNPPTTPVTSWPEKPTTVWSAK
jgi:hypothetical protein